MTEQFKEPTTPEEVNELAQQAKKMFSYERRLKLFTGVNNKRATEIIIQELERLEKEGKSNG